jgi:hypothetical protein
MKHIIFILISIYCLGLGAQIIPIPPIDKGPKNEDAQGLTKCDNWYKDALKYEEEYVQKSGLIYKDEKSFFKLINNQMIDSGMSKLPKGPNQCPTQQCNKTVETETLEKIVAIYKDAKYCKLFSLRKSYIKPIQKFIKLNE